MFAIKVRDSSGSAPLLHALSSGSNTARSAHSYTFLKAVKIMPQAHESLIIDSRHTAITLKVWLTTSSVAVSAASLEAKEALITT